MSSVELIAKSLTELLSIRARDTADTTFVYTGDASDGSKVALRSLTFKEGQAAVDRLAWHYSKLDICPKVAAGEVPPVQVVSVLTSSSINETFLEIALAKLGLTGLLLAANNSVAAVAHLTKLTKATHLIYGTKFEETAKEACAILAAQDYPIQLIPEVLFPLWGPQGIASSTIEPFPPYLTPDQEASRPAVVLHSSGSTGFPKPVFLPHAAIVYLAATNNFSSVFSTLPLFHAAGHFLIFASIYAGGYICIFPPHLPLTSGNICKTLELLPNVRQTFAVPYVIKLLGETEEGMNAMSSMDIVASSGAPLPDDLGDRLVAAGVNIVSLYGATEYGCPLASVRNFAEDKLWNWLRPTRSAVNYLVFEPHGADTFELVVKDGFPTKVQTNRPDGSYATKDLFRRHPEHPNYYRYIGRLDDTLVHTLGEKTNPVPMENCIRGNSPFVKEAIVFGASRSQTGCLILPADEGKNLSTQELLEKVWPVIEQANEEAPSHSRILREMVEILPHGTVIPASPKLSFIRPACYTKFADIIDSVYKRIEREDSVGEKRKLVGVELEDYLVDTISSILDGHHVANLNPTVDLFAFGVDSIHAGRIHNRIQQEIDLGGQKLSSTVVYDHPSIRKLASYLEQLQGVGTGNAKTDKEKMLGYVEKWLEEVKPCSISGGRPKPVDARVVVLTGATGSLGAHILSRLTASTSVRKVICLSRARSHEDSLERLKKSAVLRKVQIDEKKIVSYSATVQAPLLGLTEEQYIELKSEVTDVIHNAWPVNFVMNIDSFDEHIGGAANLMNLALETPWSEPATFLFSSSISCRMASPDEFCNEDFPQTPETAAGTGYAQSKWVVEKLSEKASEKTGLPVAVLRIGQMSGDSMHGIWNETEAWPLLIKSANTVGALPVVDEHPSWLPVDYAGEAIAEIALNASKPAARVYNIVNPNTETNFKDMVDWIAEAGLEFDKVDRLVWVDRLATSEQDPAKNPTIKLLGFFSALYGSDFRQQIVFRTDETLKWGPALGRAPPITKEIVAKWIGHWKQTGFLQ